MPNAPRRVGDVTVYDRNSGTWKRIDPSRRYRVSVSDYLIRCGDGFSMLADATPVTSCGVAESDGFQFADYLRNFKGGRIASANSPLCERGYAAVLAYERPLGGERIACWRCRPLRKSPALC